MKVIVPTRACVERIHCVELAKAIGEPFFVTHSVEAAERLEPYGIETVVFECDDRITTGFLRQRAQDVLISDGEWYVTLDDNVRRITMLERPYFDQERLDEWEIDPEMFERDASIKDVHWLLDRCRNYAEMLCCPVVGFATETNFYFRKLQWQRRGYVRTQLSLQRNVGLTWCRWPDCNIEDFVVSCESVATCGLALVNRFAKPIKTMFESGGIGPLEERIPQLTTDCSKLMELYPGLLKSIKNRPWSMTFAPRSDRTVEEWRRRHHENQEKGRSTRRVEQDEDLDGDL